MRRWPWRASHAPEARSSASRSRPAASCAPKAHADCERRTSGVEQGLGPAVEGLDEPVRAVERDRHRVDLAAERLQRRVPRAPRPASISGTYSPSHHAGIAAGSKVRITTASRHAPQLGHASRRVTPLVDRDRGHRRVEGVVVERQRLGDPDHGPASSVARASPPTARPRPRNDPPARRTRRPRRHSARSARHRARRARTPRSAGPSGGARRNRRPRRRRSRSHPPPSARSMSWANAGCAYGPSPRNCSSTCRWETSSLSWLILTLQMKRVIGSRMPTVPRAIRRPISWSSQTGSIDVLLEVRDQPRQHPQVLFGLQHLRDAVAVGDAEVPGRRGRRARRVPARRDVAVWPGHDQQHLAAVLEPVDLLVRPPDVGDDRQVVRVLVEQDRVVRRDEAIGLGDERPPRVLVDQPADDGRVGLRMLRVVAHPAQASRTAQPAAGPAVAARSEAHDELVGAVVERGVVEDRQPPPAQRRSCARVCTVKSQIGVVPSQDASRSSDVCNLLYQRKAPLQGHTWDARIAAIAARQHALITIWQLYALGLDAGAVARRVARGTLHRRYRGVYAVGQPTLSPEGDPRRRPGRRAGAALSHRPAGRVHGISRFHASHIVVVTTTKRRPKGVEVHRVRTLDPRDVTTHNGIPVTTVHRTLVDLADDLTPHQLANVIHEAAYRRTLRSKPPSATAMDRVSGRRKLARTRARNQTPPRRQRRNQERRRRRLPHPRLPRAARQHRPTRLRSRLPLAPAPTRRRDRRRRALTPARRRPRPGPARQRLQRPAAVRMSSLAVGRPDTRRPPTWP